MYLIIQLTINLMFTVFVDYELHVGMWKNTNKFQCEKMRLLVWLLVFKWTDCQLDKTIKILSHFLSRQSPCMPLISWNYGYIAFCLADYNSTFCIHFFVIVSSSNLYGLKVNCDLLLLTRKKKWKSSVVFTYAFYNQWWNFVPLLVTITNLDFVISIRYNSTINGNKVVFVM